MLELLLSGIALITLGGICMLPWKVKASFREFLDLQGMFSTLVGLLALFLAYIVA